MDSVDLVWDKTEVPLEVVEVVLDGVCPAADLSLVGFGGIGLLQNPRLTVRLVKGAAYVLEKRLEDLEVQVNGHQMVRADAVGEELAEHGHGCYKSTFRPDRI